jgi:hypothetical protein
MAEEGTDLLLRKNADLGARHRRWFDCRCWVAGDHVPRHSVTERAPQNAMHAPDRARRQWRTILTATALQHGVKVDEMRRP